MIDQAVCESYLVEKINEIIIYCTTKLDPWEALTSIFFKLFPIDGGVVDYYSLMNLVNQTSIKICFIWKNLSEKKKKAVAYFYKTSLKYFIENRILQDTSLSLFTKMGNSYKELKESVEYIKKNEISTGWGTKMPDPKGEQNGGFGMWLSNILQSVFISAEQTVKGTGKMLKEMGELIKNVNAESLKKFIMDTLGIGADAFRQYLIITMSAFHYRVLLLRLNNLNNLLSFDDDIIKNITVEQDIINKMFPNILKLIEIDPFSKMRNLAPVYGKGIPSLKSIGSGLKLGNYLYYFDLEKIKDIIKVNSLSLSSKSTKKSKRTSNRTSNRTSMSRRSRSKRHTR